MVHTESRRALAQALRHYVSGQLSNDHLDEVVVSREDRGVVAVKEMAWTLYDDFRHHYAEGRHSLGQDSRREIARWILFLNTDLEYAWPVFSFRQSVNWPMDLITRGWWERRKRRAFVEFKSAGDFSVWPFLSQSEFEVSLCYSGTATRVASGLPSCRR